MKNNKLNSLVISLTDDKEEKKEKDKIFGKKQAFIVYTCGCADSSKKEGNFRNRFNPIRYPTFE